MTTVTTNHQTDGAAGKARIPAPFDAPMPSPRERRAAGKARRKLTPRAAHARWQPPDNPADADRFDFEATYQALRDAELLMAVLDGYIVDELPEPMQAVYDFGEYRSKTVVDGKVLRYARSYTIKSLQVPVERFGDLRKFFARIGADQRAYAILRKASPASAK